MSENLPTGAERRTLIVEKQPIILASASPRRRDLLTQAGVSFVVWVPDVDEELNPGTPPMEAAQVLAERKARLAAREHPESWVLAADTLVWTEEEILGKPRDPGDARRMLTLLSGRTHRVTTGFCLGRENGGPWIVDAVTTEVAFRDLSPGEIEWYIQTGEPFDKAGGYGIQGLGVFLVREIRGSYTNVVGLPVCEVLEHLAKAGVIERTVG
ncbi:MAG: Maf family protein [Pseudomonadota bacterium]